MKKTSLSDIARALGVSKSLVSLVLNGRGDEVGINRETQKRVLAMAEKMNYKPNLVARGLRLGASRTLGLIVPNIANPFFARITRVVEDEAGRYGYSVMSGSSDEDPAREVGLIKVMQERQIDGLILASSLKEQKDIRVLQEDKTPFVLIDRYFPDLKTHRVLTDNYAGAYEVVSHLIGQGYRKIGLLKIGPSYLTPIRLRHQGYLEALRSHDIGYEEELVREIPFGAVGKEVEEALDLLLPPGKGAEALFFLNNDLTVAGLSVIRKKGLRIPDDVAVVSYDDLDLFSLLTPSVTAVAQPWEKMAREAVRILLEEIRHPGVTRDKEEIILPPELKIRGSSRRR
jgi:LacI family transcriptional regulator